jgi:hypothetical protein
VGRGGRERESKDPLTGCPGPQPPVTPLSGETDRSTLVFPVFGSNASTFFNGFSRSSPIVLPRIYYPQISEILYIENSTMVFDMREYFYGILLQRNNIPLEVNSDGSWINIGSGTPEYIRQICSIRCTTEVSAAANKVIELAQNHREEFGLGGPGSELTAEQVLSGYLTHYKNCQQAINGFINKCRDIRMVNRPDGGSGVGVGGGGAGRIYPPLRRDNRVPSGRVDPRLGDTLVRPRGPQ